MEKKRKGKAILNQGWKCGNGIQRELIEDQHDTNALEVPVEAGGTELSW